MTEKFSSGYHSEVYKVSPKEKLLFPKADLVRVDHDEDRLWAARLYLRHKIAQVLFPENFIEVVGATVSPAGYIEPNFTEIGGTEFKFFPKREHRLYSKMAPVSPDHATYSDHMELVEGRNSLVKMSVCSCEVCSTHREEHLKKWMEQRAQELTLDVEGTGLRLEFKDSSDYCLGERGVIFFEIEDFNGMVLEDYLNSLRNPPARHQQALRYLSRFKQLQRIARDEWFSGRANGVRFN